MYCKGKTVINMILQERYKKKFQILVHFICQKNKEYKDIMVEVCGPANSIFLVMVDATNQVSARTEVKVAMRKHP